MMKNGLGARLRYEFDKTMAAGPIALIGWLAVISLLVIVVAGACPRHHRDRARGRRAAELHRRHLGNR